MKTIKTTSLRRNRLLFTLILSTLFTFSSCGDGKKLEKAEQLAATFFKKLKDDKKEEINKIYPDIKLLPSIYLSDSAKVITSYIENDTISVVMNNYYTNGFGKINEREIVLYFVPQDNDELKLFDSNGLTSYDDDSQFKFTKNTGCLSSSDTTDLRIARAIEKSNDFYMDQCITLLKELRALIYVDRWSWERGYGGSASGQGVVFNKSSFDIPKIKYEITYLNRSGDVVTTDNGYISYDPVESMKAQSFTFYTSYVGNATEARINLNFDEELILDYISNKEWRGNEWENWIKANPTNKVKS
ncbi:MAG: hypothetical protein N4A41_00440 [Crocinitomicaceae bacterium]|jgi:hypothetical protein|nr:hypothetical protein [Crocinitomicaceae bacterium]